MNSKACVYLVGTGPGDPDLLTVKALRLIQTADVVVYDRLVSAAILEQIPAGVTKIYVGKKTGKHTLPQDEINTLLVKLADTARSIVRLKGGDPFIFGRGSEEATHLVAHRIPFEIVPGVTAASACSAYAGIPLTHRELSRGVQFVTGHCQDNQTLDLDWRSLADTDKTLVIYMGLANIGYICKKLMTAGLPANTPAAAIEKGATPQQRRQLSTLVHLQDDVLRAGFTSPVLFVIGRVVSLAQTLDWFTAVADLESETEQHENSMQA